MSKVCSGAFRSDVRCWTTCTGSLFSSALACPPIKVAAAIPTGMRNLKEFTHFLLERDLCPSNQILTMFIRQEHTNFCISSTGNFTNLIQLSRRGNGTTVPFANGPTRSDHTSWLKKPLD